MARISPADLPDAPATIKPKLDMDKTAKGLRASRRGAVPSGGGYFGALQVAAEMQARLRTPARG